MPAVDSSADNCAKGDPGEIDPGKMMELMAVLTLGFPAVHRLIN